MNAMDQFDIRGRSAIVTSPRPVLARLQVVIDGGTMLGNFH